MAMTQKRGASAASTITMRYLVRPCNLSTQSSPSSPSPRTHRRHSQRMDGAWRYVIVASFSHQGKCINPDYQNIILPFPSRAGRLERQGFMGLATYLMHANTNLPSR
ncbi:hypothetical protein IG631_17447 [Alternaria alternata]|nr:hypothetical protein IG631_17447 [Alternaria alternata]